MTDAQAVIRAVNRAEEAWAALKEAIGEKRTGDSGRRAATPTPQVPINVDAFDLAETIAEQLQGWARLTEEESGETVASFQPADCARYLAEHAIWIGGAGWAPDMVEELLASAHKARAMLGVLPKRTALDGTCTHPGCEARMWIYSDGKLWAECDDGHVATLDRASRTKQLVSIRGAKAVMRIGHTRIVEGLRSGALTNHGTEARPLVDTQEVRAYLHEAG